jgi:probable phosphoglycerate mutase
VENPNLISASDAIYAQVREYHRQYKEEGSNTRDVLIVAHGHFNRCLIARWINFSLRLGTHFDVEPGGVCSQTSTLDPPPD